MQMLIILGGHNTFPLRCNANILILERKEGISVDTEDHAVLSSGSTGGLIGHAQSHGLQPSNDGLGVAIEQSESDTSSQSRESEAPKRRKNAFVDMYSSPNVPAKFRYVCMAATGERRRCKSSKN